MNDEQWRQKLTAAQYHVCREGGTEPPFSGKWLSCKETGHYRCCCCDTVLFQANSQFDAGCGWPSFDQVIERGRVRLLEDRSHQMVRTEVRCAHCDAHLGHLFDDGPTATGLRYCINSVAIDYSAKAPSRPL